MQNIPHKISVLAVEDNAADTAMISYLFSESKLVSDIKFVGDGVEALDYLKRIGKYGGASRPDVVLLDLNLPRKDGREVLIEMKKDPSLRRIPVLVLSTSDSPKDVCQAYDLQASAYFTKPDDLSDFRRTVGAIEKYWTRSILPSICDSIMQ